MSDASERAALKLYFDGLAAGFPTHTTAIVLPILAALVLTLDIPPLLWHATNRNIAASSMVFWTLTLNVLSFVNPLIWPNDNVVGWWKGNVLCDIEARVIIAAHVALPGALICIMKGLAEVLDTENTVLVPSKRDRRTKRWIEISLTWLLPLFLTAISVVVQPGRYFIYSVSGCSPIWYPTVATVLLVWMWPLLLSTIAAVYGCLVIYRLYRYRRDFQRLLSAANTNKARFMRLFIMAAILILGVVPCQAWQLYENSSVEFLPFKWSEIHYPGWSNTIISVPTGGKVVYDRWVFIVIGVLMFLFFGTGADAAELYRGWLVHLGFARIFPRLSHSDVRSTYGQNSYKSARLGFIGSKARSLFSSNMTSKSEMLEKSLPSPRQPAFSTQHPLPQRRPLSQASIITRLSSKFKLPSLPFIARTQTPDFEPALPIYYRSSVTVIHTQESPRSPGTGRSAFSDIPLKQPDSAHTVRAWSEGRSSVRKSKDVEVLK